MPFSNGIYTLPPGSVVVTGTVISSTVQNTMTADLATALSSCLLKDGSQTVTNNVPFAGFKLTGIGAAAARTDAASIATIQDGTGVYVGTVGGTADAILLTPSPVITAYVAGQEFSFVVGSSNTTATTVNINAVGVKSITKQGATALVAGDLASGALVAIEYDGTQFQLKNPRTSSSGGGALTITSRSTNTILGVNDLGALFQFTSTFTQTFTAAATLGSGWYIDLQNIGTGIITLDANGSETFNTPGGARTTINVYPGEGFRVVCNATGFDLVGRNNRVLLGFAAAVSTSFDCETGFTDTELSRIDIQWNDIVVGGGGGAVGMRVRKSGAYITTSTYDSGIAEAAAAGYVSVTAQAFGFIGRVNTTTAQNGELKIGRPTIASNTHMMIFDSACPGEATSPANVRAMGGIFESTNAAIAGVRIIATTGTISAGYIAYYGNRA